MSDRTRLSNTVNEVSLRRSKRFVALACLKCLAPACSISAGINGGVMSSGDVDTVGTGVADCAARCSCNRASYPGDGVTVGGAARIGDAMIRGMNVATANTA